MNPSLLLLPLCFAYQQYCRCECNAKHTITEIDKCGLCTKDFCLSQEACDSETDIVISCFQKESLKEKVVIYSFGAVVVCMGANALYRSRNVMNV